MVLDIGNVPTCRGDGSYRHGARTFTSAYLLCSMMGYFNLEAKEKKKERVKENENLLNHQTSQDQKKKRSCNVDRAKRIKISIFPNQQDDVCITWITSGFPGKPANSRRTYDIKLYSKSETRFNRLTPSWNSIQQNMSSSAKFLLSLIVKPKAYVPFSSQVPS